MCRWIGICVRAPAISRMFISVCVILPNADLRGTVGIAGCKSALYINRLVSADCALIHSSMLLLSSIFFYLLDTCSVHYISCRYFDVTT